MKLMASDTRLDVITRNVRLRGLAPVMFDRYAGDNTTKLSWHEKIYLKPGTSTVVLPSTNLMSLLSAHNTNSAPKRLRDARQFKKICNACLSFVNITAPDGGIDIPFLREGIPVEVGAFGDSKDEQSGIFLHRAVARLDKGIPNPKERPVLPAPWELEFNLTIYPNKEIKEAEIKNLIEDAGIAIGIGTYRGVYGKFFVEAWT